MQHIEQMQNNARPARAHRMTERHRAAIDVESCRVGRTGCGLDAKVLAAVIIVIKSAQAGDDLRRKGGGRGLASICIGGGQGGAMLVETV